jgi:endonuclease III
VLIAVLLSAQCTDERVNRVAPQLFARIVPLRRDSTDTSGKAA